MLEGRDPLGLLAEDSVFTTDEDGVAAVSLPVGEYQVKMEHGALATEEFKYSICNSSDGHYQPFKRVRP